MLNGPVSRDSTDSVVATLPRSAPLTRILSRPQLRSQKDSEQLYGDYRVIAQQNKGFEPNRTRKFTRTFGKIFVAQFLCGTFSVPDEPKASDNFPSDSGRGCESLVRKPDPPYYLQWEQFCPDQVLLSKNLRSRPDC